MINNTWIKLGVFITVLAVMMLWEGLKPNRVSPVSIGKRWFSNFSMILLGSVVARLMIPTGLAAMAIFAQSNHIGLWNHVSASVWLSIPISVLLFDCLIYWQHRLFHRIPLFWRIHRVHHADPHLDASTGLRFHPLEIALSLVVKISAVLVLGAPVLAILIFEVLLNATSIFNHSNIKLAVKLDKLLRTLIVTQAMHRIHHSQVVAETDSNFGFNLSIWDRLFGSYIEEAQNGDDGIKLGLKEYSSPQTNTSLKALLLMPFKQKPH
ncbi:sterol desaturase family protein [Paraglaciecola sp. MB-3u-78]|jgi:sterol desaturase/sphingolipid hydroxylase (fatty acid hydroxylase superfamily)|uniref:sterol desaturase family protein n=1 Tax=Paraglaciecola sp. MB-3u-78 TaxID=2058332 RepID=UPI000C32C435|nr:sterol desaturase family protein [Paraglaciecola sp. MB-3u-78]PKG97973.1 sterol desaturase [Paraglaciecola sp. MB-3u-78]